LDLSSPDKGVDIAPDSKQHHDENDVDAKITLRRDAFQHSRQLLIVGLDGLGGSVHLQGRTNAVGAAGSILQAWHLTVTTAITTKNYMLLGSCAV
jgi:hypothetical protein